MKLFIQIIQIMIFSFLFFTTNNSFAKNLFPVNLKLQFETDKEQQDWIIIDDFTNLPEISGKIGNLHKSWDSFFRKFLKDHLLSGKFGETVIKEINLESQLKENDETFLVTIKTSLEIENRDPFEYFVNHEHLAYHCDQCVKGYVFYASHQTNNSYVSLELPSLKNPSLYPVVPEQIPNTHIRRFVSLLNSAILSENVKSPETQLVKELPGLAVNYTLIRLLESLLHEKNIITIRNQLEKWMWDAIEFRMNELDGELLRLSDKQVEMLSQYLQFPIDLFMSQKREALFQLYKTQLDNLQLQWKERIDKAVTNDNLNELVSVIISSVEKQYDFRHLKTRKVLSYPIRKIARNITHKEIEKVHHAAIEEQESDHTFTIYTISEFPVSKPLIAIDRNDLLSFYAPEIVQAQQINQLRYNPAMDQIGMLKIIRNRNNDVKVFVDVSQPVVYSHIRKVQIGINICTQLTYEFWYQEHPEMFEKDKEAGLLDGRFLTITLDESNQPIIYETAMNCGCFYEIYVTGQISKDAFSQLSDTTLPTTFRGKPVSGILPSHGKLCILMNAGFHTVTKLDKTIDSNIVKKSRKQMYNLENAEAVELIHFEDGYTSVYNNNGLIRDGGRPESYLLWMSYPENYYAGWNRHQSQRRYGLDPNTDGFHNPFWIQSVFLEESSSFGIGLGLSQK